MSQSIQEADNSHCHEQRVQGANSGQSKMTNVLGATTATATRKYQNPSTKSQWQWKQCSYIVVLGGHHVLSLQEEGHEMACCSLSQQSCL
jgi:hypothetical protein